MKSAPMKTHVTHLVNVCVNQITQAKNVISARMDIMIGRVALTVSAIFMELNQEFATKTPENVSVKRVMDQHDAIVAFLDFSIILSAFLAIAQQPVQFQQHAITTENVLAFRTLLESDVINVWLDSINSPSVYHVIAILMALMELLAIMMVNVTANTISMAKTATRVKRISTTIHSVRAAIVTQQVSLLNSLVAAQCPLENFVNVKNVFKEEFAINVDHFIGT